MYMLRVLTVTQISRETYLATFELLARLASKEHDPQLELTEDK